MTWSKKAESGSISLELVIFAPLLLLFISVMIFGGRMALAGQAVQQAADEAARTASISRSLGAAQDADEAARATLVQQDLDCARIEVEVDSSGLNAPIGEAASVRATVTCFVRVGDLAIPGLPGTRTVTATAVSPIDTWRER